MSTLKNFEEVTQHNRQQFTFYSSFYDAVLHLPKREQGKAILAMAAYVFDGVEVPLSGSTQAFFMLVKPVLDAGARRAAAGSIGGSKLKANGKQTVSEIEKEKELEIDIENEYGKQTGRGGRRHLDEDERRAIRELLKEDENE